MRSKHIRALRNELIADLDLDKSATTEQLCVRLCQVMADRLERRIQLRFDPLGESISGLWAVSNDGTHVVVVTTARSWMHRLVILLHEIAHMLCNHQPATLTDRETHQLFYPDLSPEMLKIVASRTTLSRREEAEADRVAGALARGLHHWANQQDIPAFDPSQELELVTRMYYTLGYTPRRDARE
jgi:hypothetical protein